MAGLTELEPYLNNRNVRAFLDMIADAEGTSKYANPYAVAGGGKVMLQDLSQAQFPMWGFKQTDGKQNQSSAAGKFQFLRKTWDGLKNQYGLQDFGERSQTLGAIALLKQNGALPYVVAGDWGNAVAKAGPTWASLPSSVYKQGKRSNDFVQKSLSKHLNAPVAMLQPTTVPSGIPVSPSHSPPAPAPAPAPALVFQQAQTPAKQDPYQELFASVPTTPTPMDVDSSWGLNDISNVSRDYGKVHLNYLE